MGNDFLISVTISASCSIKKRFSIFKKYINCINKFIYLFDTMEIIIYKLSNYFIYCNIVIYCNYFKYLGGKLV